MIVVGLGKVLMIAVRFFGITIFVFGLLLTCGSPIAGLIVLFVGVLMCYGGSRSGREGNVIGGGISEIERIRRISYANNLNPNNPNNPDCFMKRYRK